jgi:hypothetical protein
MSLSGRNACDVATPLGGENPPYTRSAPGHAFCSSPWRRKDVHRGSRTRSRHCHRRGFRRIARRRVPWPPSRRAAQPGVAGVARRAIPATSVAPRRHRAPVRGRERSRPERRPGRGPRPVRRRRRRHGGLSLRGTSSSRTRRRGPGCAGGRPLRSGPGAFPRCRGAARRARCTARGRSRRADAPSRGGHPTDS